MVQAPIQRASHRNMGDFLFLHIHIGAGFDSSAVKICGLNSLP